ncbi:MAG: NAD(P)-dependent oxidoreductase [Chloroflexota bacterium]|nr:3-phosphoglycerate dehydrogenase [Chloroflexota bacterium]MDE2942087.1 3-phosphoglycerate dehydrogenase [Chloroflexota bacterium]MDE3268133.1 NAD(P)-dependent oxidoreductase [Chloroflexota bacterium]
MNIVVPDDAARIVADSGLEPQLRELGTLRVHESGAYTEALLAERIAEADVALSFAASPFIRAVLEACPRLRHIAVFGIGVDNVDLDACRQRGITVTNTPGYSAATVAEKAIALALAVAHRMPMLDASVRRGGWPQEPVGQLHGATLGVVGTGPIGQRVIAVGRGLGMDAIAWTFNPSEERAQEYGARFVGLDELLARSDVVSLQLPLSAETEGLFGARELALMKPTAILVNVGRGAVVDEDALVAALQAGRIGGAGLDVFAIEPLPAAHPLTTLDSVVLSPHNAANTPQANRAGLELAIRNIRDWQQGTLRTSIV